MPTQWSHLNKWVSCDFWRSANVALNMALSHELIKCTPRRPVWVIKFMWLQFNTIRQDCMTLKSYYRNQQCALALIDKCSPLLDDFTLRQKLSLVQLFRWATQHVFLSSALATGPTQCLIKMNEGCCVFSCSANVCVGGGQGGWTGQQNVLLSFYHQSFSLNHDHNLFLTLTK